MKKYLTRKVTALTILSLVFVLVLSSFSTVFACSDDDIPIERCKPHLSECENIDEDDIETEGYLVCPKCDRGRITRKEITVKDYQVEFGPHGSCKMDGEHYQLWYQDWLVTECDTCNYYDRIVTRHDYGWWCQRTRP